MNQSNQIALFKSALDVQDPAGKYLVVLQTLAIVGVADNQQLAQATELSRDQLFRLLKKIQASANATSPFELIAQPIVRAGGRGRAPKVYRLNEAGAAILRAQGQTKARACALNDETAIAHALGILDENLVAHTHARKIQIDQNVPFGNGRVIRPDAQVTLTDGTRALFEIEQAATPDLLRRVCESVQHKFDFFSAVSRATRRPCGCW
jgi:hypothetical protein